MIHVAASRAPNPYPSASKNTTPLHVLSSSPACYIFLAYMCHYLYCYFVVSSTYYSHSTGTTQWVDPRLAQVKKATVDECDDDGK